MWRYSQYYHWDVNTQNSHLNTNYNIQISSHTIHNNTFETSFKFQRLRNDYKNLYNVLVPSSAMRCFLFGTFLGAPHDWHDPHSEGRSLLDSPETYVTFIRLASPSFFEGRIRLDSPSQSINWASHL